MATQNPNERNPCECGNEKGSNQNNCTPCKQHAEEQTAGNKQ